MTCSLPKRNETKPRNNENDYHKMAAVLVSSLMIISIVGYGTQSNNVPNDECVLKIEETATIQINLL